MAKELQVSDVLVEKFSAKGCGIGRLSQGKEVEIAHGVPGDFLQVGWRKGRRGMQKGRLLDVIASSPIRVKPRCAHAQICGGCAWQQMDYAEQLKEKQRRVEAAFGGFAADPIIACDPPFGYRNKMEFSFSQNRAGERYLGLRIAQAGSYVFNVLECHLGPSWFAQILEVVRQWWASTSLEAYYPPQDRGTLRHLTLREAFHTKQKMAVLTVSGRAEFAPLRGDLERFAAALKEHVGEIAVFVRVHQAQKGVATQFYEMHLAGPDHIIEELHLKEDVYSLKISPVSFFQPNTVQAEKLYLSALGMVSHPAGIVYDLYAGTGTLGIAFSRIAERVIGIELSPEAVLDAEENMEKNQISNYTMHQGDVGRIISDWMQSGQFHRPDVALVDPPRMGLDDTAMRNLKNLAPRSIVYVSCNPLTQALNVAELIQAGYVLKRLQPVDQFPHTYHIENIALLER